MNETQRAADALWQYVISVKSVRKRDGTTDLFDPTKLESSLRRAMNATGHDPAMPPSSQHLAELALDRLQKTFDGHRIPTSDDVRVVASDILREHGLDDAVRAYQDFASSPKPPRMNLPDTKPKPATDYVARRRRLPDERRSVTHKFEVGPHQGYITVGLYDDGNPGEIFLTMSKEGSALSGLVDAFATSISIGLQYGVPLKVFVNKFAHTRFEPSGATQNPNLPYASSIVDYVFRWLALKFLTPEERQAMSIHGEGNLIEAVPSTDAILKGTRLL